MPKLSTNNDQKKINQFIDSFWNVVTLLEEKEETVGFFEELLTPTEIRMLAKRLKIASMLSKKYKYSEIQQEVKVTKQTIANISNKLKFKDSEIIKILLRLDRLEKERNIGKGFDYTDVQVARVIRHNKKTASVKKDN